MPGGLTAHIVSLTLVTVFSEENLQSSESSSSSSCLSDFLNKYYIKDFATNYYVKACDFSAIWPSN